MYLKNNTDRSTLLIPLAIQITGVQYFLFYCYMHVHVKAMLMILLYVHTQTLPFLLKISKFLPQIN